MDGNSRPCFKVMVIVLGDDRWTRGGHSIRHYIGPE
jgi:hypothetical protein